MAAIKDGATYLGNHLSANDYYAEGERIIGHWEGEMAKEFGIEGKTIHPDDAVFENLRVGKTPDGKEKLTQRDGGSIRFYDFQCSAQKSVSVMSMVDERLAGAHDRAAAKAFGELETFAARRLRSGNKAWTKESETTGKVIAGVFRHDASRALDPQLHTHHVTANVTVTADGKRYALDNTQMCEAIRYAGKVYQNELAKEVKQLGYEIDPKHGTKGQIEGFEIKGVSSDILERYSKRREAVEEGIAKFVAKKGRQPTSEEIRVITKDTRDKKLKEITTPEVRANQLSQLSPQERASLESLTSRAKGPPPSPSRSGGREAECLNQATAHCFERASVVRSHELMAEAINRDLGGIDLPKLRASLHKDPALVTLNQAGLRSEIATQEGLRTEVESVRLVNQSKGTCERLCSKQIKISEKLSGEQQRVVEFIASTKDKVVAVRGVAGAGKTTTLKEVDKHLGAAGHRTLYLAPTRSAVDVLKSEGFPNATTVSDYLVRSEHGKDPSEWRNAVVVVDEAGLQSSKQGYDVLKLAERHGNRVVMVGDVRQHSSVEAGDFMRILEDHSQLSRVELKDIRRQQVAEYNQAIREMAGGRAAVGMERLDQMGWVKEGGADYLDHAAKDYLRLSDSGKNPDKVLVVAPTWAENHQLSDKIRGGMIDKKNLGEVVQNREVWISRGLTQQGIKDQLRPGQEVLVQHASPKSGLKAGEILTVKETQGNQVKFSDGRQATLGRGCQIDVGEKKTLELRAGERVLIRANDHKRGLANGDIVTVRGVTKDGQLQVEKTGKEAKQVLLGKENTQMAYGYAVTSHKSQGRTVDHVVVAAARMDQKAAYVSASRGRQSCTVHTPEKQRLFDGLPRSGDRKAALDVVRQKEASPTPQKPSTIERVKAWGKDVGQKIQQGWKRVKEVVRQGPTVAKRQDQVMEPNQTKQQTQEKAQVIQSQKPQKEQTAEKPKVQEAQKSKKSIAEEIIKNNPTPRPFPSQERSRGIRM